MRSMFIPAILFGELNSPLGIWDMFKEDFRDDLEHRWNNNGIASLLRSDHPDATFQDNKFWVDYGLYLISNDLNNQEKTMTEFCLPEPLCP
ncbi:hypothetical protein BDB01DRAFT_795567 [Pilobolus umbonatus]|nr:hypothetical protein BDB01DRAFT_795567 [Pilobolus umbonatus]